MEFYPGSCRKRRWGCLLALTTAFMLSSAVTSQASDLAQLLSGRVHPMSLQLKDLSGEWRRVTLRGGVIAGGNVGVNVSGSAEGSTSQNNNMVSTLGAGQAYVTRGQTVSAGDQTYLVAYLLPSTALDLSAILQAMATKTPPQMKVLTPESPLHLSLVNVKAIVSIEDVRAFDMNEEIGQSQEAAKKLAEMLKAMAEAGKPAKPPEKSGEQKPEKK
jgi:hypothetical protein